MLEVREWCGLRPEVRGVEVYSNGETGTLGLVVCPIPRCWVRVVARYTGRVPGPGEHGGHTTETLDRLSEVDPFHPLHEVNDVAVGVTPEAVEVIVTTIDEQARMMVIVEGTAHHRGPATSRCHQAIACHDCGEWMVAFEHDEVTSGAQPDPRVSR